MLTRRGLAVLASGLLLWVAARVLGSTDLTAVAVGLTALPLIALVSAKASSHELRTIRKLSSRGAFPGTQIRVSLTVENRYRSRTPPLLLEDSLPRSLGRSARAVVAGIPAGTRREISYTFRCGARGRYLIGPLLASVSDPFFLARQSLPISAERDDLLVYPEIEELAGSPAGGGVASAGETTVRRLFRTGGDFFGMREYEVGDDLRRVHWASTARMGQLMIRQEEAERGAGLALYLDTRSSAYGGPGEPFERAVSAAASVGFLYVRSGFGLRFGTPDLPPRIRSRQEFLELLATVRPARERLLSSSLRTLGRSAAGTTALVVITHPPSPEETGALIGAGTGYATRMAIFIIPYDPKELWPGTAAEREGAVATETNRLVGAGWQVLALPQDTTLRQIWDTHQTASRVTVSG